jgi:hypothetical protein
LPPLFSREFFSLLRSAAEQFGTSRADFALRALKYYVAALREKSEKAQAPKPQSVPALTIDQTELFRKMSSKVAREWWSNLSPEERAQRAATARAARAAKAKKSAAKSK